MSGSYRRKSCRFIERREVSQRFRAQLAHAWFAAAPVVRSDRSKC